MLVGQMSSLHVLSVNELFLFAVKGQHPSHQLYNRHDTSDG